MFTGIVLHYLLKELDLKGETRIIDVVRKNDLVSVVFKDNSITANLSGKSPYISLKRIKGQGYFSTFFRDKKILKIEQSGLDRILIAELEKDLRIVFEIFGRRSDCIFIKKNDILNSFKGIKKGEYKIPLKPEGLNLFSASKKEIVNAIVNKEKILGLTVGFINGLRLKGIDFVNVFAEKNFAPTVYDDILSPYLLPEGKKFSTMNEAIIYHFEGKNREKEEEKKREIVEEQLEKQILKREEILNRLNEPEDFLIYRQKGNALLTYQQKIDFSENKIVLDYLGKKLEVEIDPSLSIMENANKYFELSKKKKRKAESEERRKEKIRNELKVLKKKKEKLKSAVDLTEFEELYKKKEEKENKETFPSKFRVFTTSNGSIVLVGKNAEANNDLTFSFARPYDIFLHVKNAPGSHTILRVKDKNKVPPIDDIHEAAFYAAKFSKLKHSKSVPVSYSEKRYVRGAKGLAKGTVILEREKVVYVNPEG